MFRDVEVQPDGSQEATWRGDVRAGEFSVSGYLDGELVHVAMNAGSNLNPAWLADYDHIRWHGQMQETGRRDSRATVVCIRSLLAEIEAIHSRMLSVSISFR